ncbi:hypothetical protein HanXRQr2_Chr02g0053301 [Helianthus annuus]|uniref:Uncharacterized protein n=1 Tax=Helianthus annuus TaxID=4232 RepID=A0A251T286_HELAN|nr:hypothetical protein HanXRQr2_Chr02g0053301 [Helianthus annuus]KAJ0950802.1 hypothetical protein HanPSC8_Chr02g0052431 [Helianthus annuus]
MMLYLFLAHISHQIVPYLSSTGFWKLAATTARYSGQAVGVETGIDRGFDNVYSTRTNSLWFRFLKIRYGF